MIVTAGTRWMASRSGLSGVYRAGGRAPALDTRVRGACPLTTAPGRGWTSTIAVPLMGGFGDISSSLKGCHIGCR